MSNVQKILNANTLVFTDDEGNVHTLDIQRVITDNSISPAEDETKRHNYFPTRPVQAVKNGLFSNKNELRRELSLHVEKEHEKVSLDDISKVYHNSWNMFDDAITMLSIIKIPKKLVIASSGTTVMKIFSIYGEDLCLLNLDQPLPYSWKLIADTSSKMLERLQNSISVLKEIEDDNPTRTFIGKALFRSKVDSTRDETSNTFLTSVKSQGEIYQKSLLPKQKQVVTFHQLYQEVSEKDRLYKNPAKLSLKQLESKKKETLTSHPEEHSRPKYINMHKFDTLPMFESGKEIRKCF